MEINNWFSGCLVQAFAWSINQPGTRLGQIGFRLR